MFTNVLGLTSTFDRTHLVTSLVNPANFNFSLLQFPLLFHPNSV